MVIRWLRRRTREIEKKYQLLGGQEGVLGPPKSPESDTPDRIGRYQEYRDGAIYWSPRTGAHEVHGMILRKWETLGKERGFLGYPRTGETIASDGIGRFNHFENGSIYMSPHTGPHEVHGEILKLWQSLGAEQSKLGYPTSDEMDGPKKDSRLNTFQHGSIYWDAQSGAYEIFPLPPSEEFNAATHGQWGIPPFDSKVVGIHAALLHTDKVLFFSHGDATMNEVESQEPAIEVGSAVLDMGTKSIKQQHIDDGLICSGHTFLPDGRLVVCGSERKRSGVHALRIFTPGGRDDGQWTHHSNLKEARWYPTCTTLPDGRVFIVGGHKWFEDENTPNKTYEIFDPATGLQGPKPLPFPNDDEAVLYPFSFVLPDGRMLIHTGTKTHFLNLSTWRFEHTVLEAADRPDRNARTYDVQGTAVLLPLLPDSTPPYCARVMLIGGGGAPQVCARTPATNTCEILDLGAPSPRWKLATPMSCARVMPDATLLPDGTVLVTGGSYTGKANAGANPVLATELYDPRTGKWTTASSMSIPRLYHSTALLLANGRVLTAGMDSMWHPATFNAAKLRLELFAPPYISRGTRPIIFAAPNEIGYEAEFEVQSSMTDSIKAAALISLSSVTHSFNSNQRYVGLSILDRRADALRLLSPPNSYIAPPGYYLLFLVTEMGIPSRARFVNVH